MWLFVIIVVLFVGLGSMFGVGVFSESCGCLISMCKFGKVVSLVMSVLSVCVLVLIKVGCSSRFLGG